MVIKKTYTPRPSRPTPPPHSFLGLSAEELKRMLCEEEKNVNDTARSFSSDAERITALQTGDAGLSGEVPNLQDGVISSPLGRSSHGDDVPKLGHAAALGDVAQDTSDGSSGQNIVESKRLRSTVDGCSWESKRSKNGPSTPQGKIQKPVAVSQLGSRSNEDASAKPRRSVALEDVPQNINVGSAGQNTADLKKPRNATGRYSWKNKNEKTGSERKLQVSKEPTGMSEVQTSKPAKLEINNTADGRTILGVSKNTWVKIFFLLFLVSLPVLYVVSNNIISPSTPISVVDAANISQPLMPYLIPLLPIPLVPEWLPKYFGKNGQTLEPAQQKTDVVRHTTPQ